MHIKTIKILLFLVCISTRVLCENSLSYYENPGESLDPPKQSNVNVSEPVFQEDTLEIKTFAEADEINIPFGKTNKKHTTGAITVINPEDLLLYNSIHDVSSAITGFIPGSFGGLNIRGLGDAVVIVDGVPRPISSVNIEEVEQITVLKDVNASVLYGVQGNNGLIMITTKRGQPNLHKVNLSVEQGFSLPVSLPKYLNAVNYMELYNEALENDSLPALYTEDQINNTRNGINPVLYPDADYYTSEFLKNSKSTTRVVSEFSGGNVNAQYYLSAGWHQAGTLLNMGEGANDKDNRLNLRSQVNFKITDFISSYINVAAIWDITRRANGNFWTDAGTLWPNLYPPLIDTGMVHDKTYIPTANLINGKYLTGGKPGYHNNIYANLHQSGYFTQTYSTVQFNNGINFDLKAITKGLSFKTFVGFDFYNQYRETQSNTYAVYEPVWTLDVNNEDSLSLNKIGQDVVPGTKSLGNTASVRNLAFHGALDYSRVFGDDHEVNAIMLAYGEYFRQAAVIQPSKKSHLGMRVNYAYKNRYIIDFSSALVSSAMLHSSNRLGFSPSVGLGWILSEESFMNNNSIVDFLKLKISTSSLNTDVTIPGYYLYEGTFISSTAFSWNDGSRILSSSMVNTERNYNLFYQVRKEINAGLEAVLFNNSLWLDVNIFRERNTNLITQPLNTYPDYLGGVFAYENYGEEKYSGLEIGTTWRELINNNLSFEIGGNIAYVTTEVVKRDELWGYDYLYRTGKPVSAFFGLEAIGLFEDEDDITSHIPQSFGEVRPGDIKYKDQNDDGIIDANDAIMIGQFSPDLYGGIHLKLRFRNFTLFTLATGTTGAQGHLNNAYYWVYGDRKYSEFVMNRWTPSTSSEATYPRLTSQSSSNNYRYSTYWLYDNSFITLNRLQLTYNLPDALASKLLTRDLNVYLRAGNLFTLSKNKEIINLNIGTEPRYTYYAVGIKAFF